MGFGLEYRSTDQWNESLWSRAEKVYNNAFPEHGRKPLTIIRRMFERGMCTLDTWSEQGEVAAMALASYNLQDKMLVIDYLAVGQDWRGKGIGRLCIENIRKRISTAMPDCRGIVIEVEAERSKENEERIRFWEKAGFHLTDYVHSYIWVPEKYRAMFLSLDGDSTLADDGKRLFETITEYHEKAYRGRA
jgi:GNAT superfamily N-acetyltransferase